MSGSGAGRASYSCLRFVLLLSCLCVRACVFHHPHFLSSRRFVRPSGLSILICHSPGSYLSPLHVCGFLSSSVNQSIFPPPPPLPSTPPHPPLLHPPFDRLPHLPQRPWPAPEMIYSLQRVDQRHPLLISPTATLSWVRSLGSDEGDQERMTLVNPLKGVDHFWRRPGALREMREAVKGWVEEGRVGRG